MFPNHSFYFRLGSLAFWLILLSACSGSAPPVEQAVFPPPPRAEAPRVKLPPPAPPRPQLPKVDKLQLSDLEIQVVAAFPIHVNAVLRGTLPDGCTYLDRVEEEHNGSLFIITAVVGRDPVATCLEPAEPFEYIVPLHVDGLPAGFYAVSVNDRHEIFEMPVDNWLWRRGGKRE